MLDTEHIKETVEAIDDAVADLLRARMTLVGDGGQGVLIEMISANLERNEDFVAAVVAEKIAFDRLLEACGESCHQTLEDLQEAIRTRAGLSADAGFQIGLCVARQVRDGV